MPDGPSQPTRLLLARHGQSEWNAVGRWQGQADPPLTSLGQRQAAAAAETLGSVDAVWSSDLVRAHHTAVIIAEALGIGPVQVDEALRERHAGEWTGLTRPEIDDRWPGAPDNGIRPPGWEPDDQLRQRAMGALGRLAWECDGGAVLVVTHTGLIYTVEAHLGAAHERLPNLGARELRWDRTGPSLGPRLDLLQGAAIEHTFNDQL